MKAVLHRFKRGGWLVLLLGVILLAPTISHAQTKTLYWDRYIVDIDVQTNGDLVISEQQTIVFTGGSFTYGYRTIPMDKTDGITDIEISEGDRQYTQSSSNREFTFTADKEGNELVVYWYFPRTSGSKHTFTFRYTVHGGIKIDEKEGDSVFWKAIPPDHNYPINNAWVNVTFPEGVEYGDMVVYSTEAETIVSENTVTFMATEVLPAGQEMEVGVAIAPGLIQAGEPSWQSRQEAANIMNLLLGVGGGIGLIGGLVGVILLWYLRGKDPEIGPLADYIEEPPAGIPPGIAGTLVDERADMQDLVASLVDLARRGYLEMIETQASTGLFGLGGGSEFTFRRTGKSWQDLLPYEKTIMDKVFGNRTQRAMSDLKNKFYTAIPKIKKDLYKETVRNKFFRSDPDTVRGRYAGIGVGLLVVTVGIGFLATSLLAETIGAIICPFIAVGIVAIAIIIVGQAMPVKTRKGAEEAAKWKAFKRYLRDIDRYTNLEEATEQFDRFLPFAIAFGIERSWINKFTAVPSTPIPIWYVPLWMSSRGADRQRSLGGGQTPSLDGMSKGMGTGLSGMSAGLVSLLNTASSTLVSRPQSSGSSGGGWSGGGFSSGGGGGGGSAGFG